MFHKICAGITAASTFICAAFCIWIAANMFSCANEMKSLSSSAGDLPPDQLFMPSFSSNITTSVKQMEDENKAIMDRLNKSLKIDGVTNHLDFQQQMEQSLKDLRQRQDEQMRRDYKGFPGHYDADDPINRYKLSLPENPPEPGRRIDSGQQLRTGAH